MSCLKMMTIDNLFFELIQVAIGTRETMSRIPTGNEWDKLYKRAMKQSLLGICFAGVKRLGANADDGFEKIGMPEMLYLTWMGMAAKIQRRNEVMNRQCVELQEMLSDNGFQTCILKGQGIATLYNFNHNENLSLLRQSGDVDVWVQNKSIPEIVEYVKSLDIKYKATAAHVELRLFDDTDIELHSKPAFFRSFVTDAKFQKWVRTFSESDNRSILLNGKSITVPTVEFNVVYILVHIYHHVLFEGVGLRQLMDYYFVLRQFRDVAEVRKTIESFGMMRFACGIMWIIKEVFALEDECLICEPNEKYGRLILNEIMTGGNFGHHDEKNRGLHGGTAISRSLNGLKRNMRFFALGPWEVLCYPLWSTWHRVWRMRHGMI